MEDPLKIYSDVLKITGESKASEKTSYGYWNHINSPSLSSSSFDRFLEEIGEYDRWSTMTENEKIYIIQFSDKVDDGLASISDYKPYGYESYAGEDFTMSEDQLLDIMRKSQPVRDFSGMLKQEGWDGIEETDVPIQDLISKGKVKYEYGLGYIVTESYASEGLYEDYIQMFPEDEWRTGGGFGQALKDNDLVKAYQRADLGNRDRLEKITGKSRYELERIAYESYANEVPYSYSSSFRGFTWTWTCPSCSQQIESDTDFENIISDHLKSHGYSDEKIRAILDVDINHIMQMDRIIGESVANEDAINPDAELDIMSTPWDEQQGRFRNERDEQSPLDNIYSESVANEVPFSGGMLTWNCPSCSQMIQYDTTNESKQAKAIFDHLKSHGYSDEKIRAILKLDRNHRMEMEWIIHDI